MGDKVFSGLYEYAVWYCAGFCGLVRFHPLDCSVYLFVCYVGEDPLWWRVAGVLWHGHCWVWRWEEGLVEEFPFACVFLCFVNDFFCYWVFYL
jgi:hypothetical protein